MRKGVAAMAFDITKPSSSQAVAGTQYSIKLGTGADGFALHDPLEPLEPFEPFEKLDSPHLISSHLI